MSAIGFVHPGLWLELRRWRAAGRRARLWWRDDDAGGACSALDRLLALAREAGVPLTLAAIPAADMATVAARTEGLAGITLAQHGVDHVNRRTGAVAGEFPPQWPRAQVVEALNRGWRMMPPAKALRAVYAPPWNDIHPELPAALASAGYAGWSASGGLGEGGAGGGPVRIDVHLDVLRWRGGARFRGRRRFLGAMAGELRRRRLAQAWDAPIGLLTHHLDHDPAAWAFLARFLPWSAREPALAWSGLDELIGGAAADTPSPALARSSRRSAAGG